MIDLSDMAPRLTVGDSPYRLSGDTEVTPDLLHRIAVYQALANFYYLRFVQSGFMMFDTALAAFWVGICSVSFPCSTTLRVKPRAMFVPSRGVMPTLGYAIQLIKMMCPKDQMIWVATKSVVARMHYNGNVPSWAFLWNFRERDIMMEFIGYSMSHFDSTGPSNAPVSSYIYRYSPRPAFMFISNRYLAPESISRGSHD